MNKQLRCNVYCYNQPATGKGGSVTCLNREAAISCIKRALKDLWYAHPVFIDGKRVNRKSAQ